MYRMFIAFQDSVKMHLLLMFFVDKTSMALVFQILLIVIYKKIIFEHWKQAHFYSIVQYHTILLAHIFIKHTCIDSSSVFFVLD